MKADTIANMTAQINPHAAKHLPINPRHTLVVMALPMESRGRIEALADEWGFPLLFTGVGKVNAAAHLAYRLGKAAGAGERLQRVMNLGTAGSHHYPAHTLLNPIRFHQHDMRVEALGFAAGQTPFEPAGALAVGETLAPYVAVDCYTGDSFITDPTLDYPAMDMEAYALAKVCQQAATPFLCLKYITDGADHNAAEAWDAKLEHASQALAEAVVRVFRIES